MTAPHWATFHRMRFASPVNAVERTFSRPDGPGMWRFCPEQALTGEGLPSFTSDVWCGFALHDTREGAEAMLADPARHLPAMAEAVGSWHALARPYAHRGTVRWRDEDETDSAIRVGGGPEEGVVAVVTSAGFLSRDPGQLPRIRRFLEGVEAVMAAYEAAPGNLRRATFNGGFDGRDGFTLSLWADARAVMAAAYKAGTHRAQMDLHEQEGLFDRSSFTRLAIVDSRGSWDGDPLAGRA